MTLQAALRHLPRAGLQGSVFFITGSPAGSSDQLERAQLLCGQSKRAPFKQQTVCSSRNPGHPRAPIWRGRLLSNESLRAVQELKRASSRGDDDRLRSVLKNRVARLLKFDLIAVLNELQRQNECDLAWMVFDIVQKEFWYKPDEELFLNLVVTMARNKRIEDIEKVYELATSEGLKPQAGFYMEIIRAQLAAGNVHKAIKVYEQLRDAGYPPNPALGNLQKAIERTGDIELANALKQIIHAEKNYLETNGEEDEAIDEELTNASVF
ncbi:hypothetical protein KP509_14G001400 [Ceratopteris richardii]|uniref:Pentatricopeptide repeat-containing protein n=1 Tax=Ceratopteris richardii TaxID=49495 RepID=A0A8T2T6Y9_CERRI|nr:hypothetical protein KP509_14G001400 [Ceratopteris richardii]